MRSIFSALSMLSQVLPAVAKLILVHFHWQVTQILDRYVPLLPPSCCHFISSLYFLFLIVIIFSLTVFLIFCYSPVLVLITTFPFFFEPLSNMQSLHGIRAEDSQQLYN